jgi:hypothetical protein
MDITGMGSQHRRRAQAGRQVTALIETAIYGAWLIAAVCYAKRT